MKRAIILFWKGLTGIIAATAEWFTVILGMKDESKYGKFIRRIVGGSLPSSCSYLPVLAATHSMNLSARN